MFKIYFDDTQWITKEFKDYQEAFKYIENHIKQKSWATQIPIKRSRFKVIHSSGVEVNKEGKFL